MLQRNDNMVLIFGWVYAKHGHETADHSIASDSVSSLRSTPPRRDSSLQTTMLVVNRPKETQKHVKSIVAGYKTQIQPSRKSNPAIGSPRHACLLDGTWLTPSQHQSIYVFVWSQGQVMSDNFWSSTPASEFRPSSSAQFSVTSTTEALVASLSTASRDETIGERAP